MIEHPVAKIVLGVILVILIVILLLNLYGVGPFNHAPEAILTIDNPDTIVMDRPLSEMPDEYLRSNIERLYKSISTEKHKVESIDRVSSLIAVYQNELILRGLSK